MMHFCHEDLFSSVQIVQYPKLNTALCGISSWSSLFAKAPVYRYPCRIKMVKGLFTIMAKF